MYLNDIVIPSKAQNRCISTTLSSWAKRRIYVPQRQSININDIVILSEAKDLCTWL